MENTTRKYTKTHEWVSIAGDVATVGISAFAVKELTDLVYMELPSIGDTLTKGQSFGEIESVKAVSDLNTPISGSVTEVNAELPDNLEWLSEDPYEKSWICKLTVADSSELDDLMSEEEYNKFCEHE